MTGFTRSPRLLKAGLVILDPASGAILRTIALQYNSDNLSRKVEVRGLGQDGGRSQPLRLRGPAVETFTLEAELDVTDQLERPGDNATAIEAGLFPQISAMEALVHPTTAQINSREALANSGTLEIAPIEMPLVLFVWSKNRVLPVRVTDLSITEEAFDPFLNPIRAKVSIGLRSLTIDDLGFAHRGGGLFMAYLQAKERLAMRAPSAALANLGLTGLPA